jgi:hypothetical protein
VDGKVEVIATRSDFGYVTVTGSILQDSLIISDETTIVFGNVRVGFVYNLCLEEMQQQIDTYLQRIAAKYPEVVYSCVEALSSLPSSTYNVVFLALPNRVLTGSELTALNAFVQSGKEKRIVLIGEYNSEYNDCYGKHNDRLNTIATALGMDTRFSTIGYISIRYDNGMNRDRLCTVNSSHYLMAGVTHLWDAATYPFMDGWQFCARPLVYIHQEDSSTLPWILEEDTITAGSRIAIHDSSIMIEDYNDESGRDSMPDKNFKFIHNLCTIFPQ